MIGDKHIHERLIQWCQENYLTLLILKQPNHFEIKGFGKLLFIPPNDDGLLIDKSDFSLMLSEEEKEIVESGAIDYLSFEFGERFYYCKPKQKKNAFNEMVFDIDFNDLKYIGEPEISFDMDYVHLGIHTEYELLNGSHSPKDWIKKAKFLKMKALGICDKNTLAGVIAFQNECVKAEIKPVLGATVNIAYNYSDSKDIQETYEGKLYVASEEGWKNLLRIMRIMSVELEQEYIPEELLLEFSQGLIFVFNNNSYINSYRETALKVVKKYGQFFEAVYYQIDTVEYFDNVADMNHLRNIEYYLQNYRQRLKPILINDSYYIDKEEFQLKEYLNKVAGKVEVYSEEQHFKILDESYLKLHDFFQDEQVFNNFFTECYENSVELANKCDFKYETGKHRLPKYESGLDISNEELFQNLLSEGFEAKITGDLDVETYLQRCEREMGVIMKAGFVDYFLILWDIVHWAKNNDVMVGPGRGSVAGSLLAYLLDITQVDPIKYDLLFERFLNEARVSGERAKAADAMPDVDLDVSAADRDRVKAYIGQRFGVDHTCSIGTYTRLQLKGAITDFARVKGIRHKYVKFITKQIEHELDYEWKDLFKYACQEKNLYEFIQRYPDLVHLTKYALNQCRSSSIHASAVIIVPKQNVKGDGMDIFDWLPIRKMEGKLVSEWEGKYTDSGGFLKEDILGLNQLDKIRNTLGLVKRNKNVEIELTEIPLDDKETFRLFQQGNNEDVFQFNSAGLKHYSKQVKPDTLEELIAMSALYRPGPMSSNAHTKFADIKHGKDVPKYDYMLEEVTKKTNSLYIYQEQVMQAVVVLGNFSLVESDILRTQIKKFDKVEMKKSEEKFIKGAMDNGCGEEEANKIWNKLLAFSGYGFNRSHSAAYSLISYWSQYLKAKHPLEFWTTAIQFARDADIPKRISEMNRVHKFIKVKPPSVNHSQLRFVCHPEDNSIYWSLAKIKNVGVVAASEIVNSRQGKLFENYSDFVKRVPKKKVNSAVVTNLILAGCFDEIEQLEQPMDRFALLKAHLQRVGKDLPDHFQTDKNPLLYKNYFWVFQQRALSGLGHIDYKKLIAGNEDIHPSIVRMYLTYDEFERAKQYKEASVCGLVLEMRERKYQGNKKMLILFIISNNDEIMMVVWDNHIAENLDFFNECKGKVVCVSGYVKDDTYRGRNVLNSTEDSKFYII